MIRIALFCSAGMSTSLLVTKMKKAAQAKEIDVAIDAFPEAAMAEELHNIDVVLLGPQIRYAFNKAKKLCDEKGVPIDVVDAVDYGTMDGEKVLNQALKMMK